jgi:hypothetical protein
VGAPSTGGDLRSDLRTDPRGDPQGDLLSAADAALYQELRVWRAEVADVAGIPVFMILTNRRLRDIVRVRPASLAAFGGDFGRRASPAAEVRQGAARTGSGWCEKSPRRVRLSLSNRLENLALDFL